VAIGWPPNIQCVKCVLNASNPCPHSHMRKLDVEGWIKLKWKRNAELKVNCAMWNEQIDGLAISHNPAPLPKQEQMRALEAKEMESSSKIDLKDVSWWMFIKNAYRHGALVTTTLSKERCTSPATKIKLSQTTWGQDWRGCGPFHLKKHIFSKHVYQKYETQHTKYNTNTETNVAQSSIKIRHVPLKEISSQAWCPTKRPWINSHDPKPIMSPHTFMTLYQNPPKKTRMKRNKYYPSEIKRSMNDAWGQNAQNNLCISKEKKDINIRHILRWSFIQKMCDKVLRTHLHTQNA